MRLLQNWKYCIRDRGNISGPLKKWSRSTYPSKKSAFESHERAYDHHSGSIDHGKTTTKSFHDATTLTENLAGFTIRQSPANSDSH